MIIIVLLFLIWMFGCVCFKKTSKKKVRFNEYVEIFYFKDID